MLPAAAYADETPSAEAADHEVDEMAAALALEGEIIVGSRTETPLAESSAPVEAIEAPRVNMHRTRSVEHRDTVMWANVD